MSKAERTAFRSLLQDPAHEDMLETLLNNSMDNAEIPFQPDAQKEKHILQVLGKISPNTAPVVHRTHFLNRSWFRYAAAILILAGVGTYFLLRTSGQKMDTAAETADLVKTIQPGGNRAVLTLADGSTILLDSALTGTIAQQGTARILKDANGSIVYDVNGSPAASQMMNTMHTPIGGKYQLTLPDGTKVWLNAASSITFPVAFPQQERSVTITGEVYFEVAADQLRPFSVSGGNAKVQVLGTQFNMNAYPDEEKLKVTLLNGAVKVSGISFDQSTVLAPGQQAQLVNEGLHTINKIDIAKVMAWKMDLFNFEDIDLEEAMRQISRWYGVKVIYEQGIPKTQLWGKMSRNTSFERVLRNLKDIGVNYKMTNKKELIILP
jgi:ferric-dicitrate binding protein FerR (iron transport regulator)